jgi:hypothetical protein
MWSHQHVAESQLSPAAIWQVLTALDEWPSWDTSMAEVKLLGPLAVGTHVSMTPSGQEPIVSTIVELEPMRRYADEAKFNGLTLRFSHTLTPLPDGGARIEHDLVVSGGPADVEAEVGAMVCADFPEAMAALLARAAEIVSANSGSA